MLQPCPLYVHWQSGFNAKWNNSAQCQHSSKASRWWGHKKTNRHPAHIGALEPYQKMIKERKKVNSKGKQEWNRVDNKHHHLPQDAPRVYAPWGHFSWRIQSSLILHQMLTPMGYVLQYVEGDVHFLHSLFISTLWKECRIFLWEVFEPANTFPFSFWHLENVKA